MSKKRKVFITVKTYPTLSTKYDELVCTAGILDDGSWARIYPLPFRKLDYENRYKKYQWMEVMLEKNKNDSRPESYKVTHIEQLHLVDKPVSSWEEKRCIILEKNRVYTNLQETIDKANRNELSLAVFKPERIVDFKAEKVEREWKPDMLRLLKQKARQFSLFQSEEEVSKQFKIVKKLPYKFSYVFADDQGKKSTMMILDWEIGALFWNCLKRTGDERTAIDQVRQKYFDAFLKKDIHLFLGTTRQFHGWAKNPFVIVGVFYPPHTQQGSLF